MIFVTTRECVGRAKVVYTVWRSRLFLKEKNDGNPILNKRFTQTSVYIVIFDMPVARDVTELGWWNGWGDTDSIYIYIYIYHIVLLFPQFRAPFCGSSPGFSAASLPVGCWELNFDTSSFREEMRGGAKRNE